MCYLECNRSAFLTQFTYLMSVCRNCVKLNSRIVDMVLTLYHVTEVVHTAR